MTLAEKLQLKPGQALFVGDAPPELDLGVAGAQSADDADAALFFCVAREDLERWRERLVGAATADRLTWVAYPKAGQLGTDLSRQAMWDLLIGEGVRPVRQIAIDETWSALRFRPV